MFANVGWGEMFIIGLVALIVLGPERLPEAARWLAGAVRRVKQIASDAQNQLQNDFGTDFDEIRKPLAELNSLRGMTPRSLVTKHLLDGDDSLFTGKFDTSATPNASAAPEPIARSTKDVFRQEAARRSQSETPPTGGGYNSFLDDAT